MKNIVLIICLFSFTSCFKSKQQFVSLDVPKKSYQPDVITDINFIGKAEGTGKNYELFGFIRWGDNQRADYEGQSADSFPGNEKILKTKQAAVYNAIQGRKDSYLIDTQFRTTEKDFLIFRSVKTEVSGQEIEKGNYRQIKKYTTDKSDTLLLPYTYTVSRNGQEVTSISASRDIPPYVANTINVTDSGSNNNTDFIINKSAQTYQDYSNPQSLQPLQGRLNDIRDRVEALNQR